MKVDSLTSYIYSFSNGIGYVSLFSFVDLCYPLEGTAFIEIFSYRL